MITIKYEKTYPANLLSHVDTLRTIQRILRRAKIDMNFSQGFNPHMLVYMSAPLSLGLTSKCEYITADVKTAGADTLKLFNEFAPQGIKGTEIFFTEKNPNMAGKVTRAQYQFECAGLGSVVKNIKLGLEYPITYTEKGEQVTKDVRDMIFAIETTDENTVVAVLSCGNKNLKADRLLGFWCKEYGLDYNSAKITKLAMFIDDVRADKFIAAMGL